MLARSHLILTAAWPPQDNVLLAPPSALWLLGLCRDLQGDDAAFQALRDAQVLYGAALHAKVGRSDRIVLERAVVATALVSPGSRCALRVWDELLCGDDRARASAAGPALRFFAAVYRRDASSAAAVDARWPPGQHALDVRACHGSVSQKQPSFAVALRPVPGGLQRRPQLFLCSAPPRRWGRWGGRGDLTSGTPQVPVDLH